MFTVHSIRFTVLSLVESSKKIQKLVSSKSHLPFGMDCLCFLFYFLIDKLPLSLVPKSFYAAKKEATYIYLAQWIRKN